MTPFPHIFMSYETIAPVKHVQTANGTLLSVMGIVTINLQPMRLITHVLHVRKLFVSLVYVQRLAKLTDYSILFYDLDAYLCSKVNRSRIGLDKIRQGLYYLPKIDPQSPVAGGLKVASVQASLAHLEPIMELHHQMGHPSNYLLKQMYPHMFKNINLESVICDAF